MSFRCVLRLSGFLGAYLLLNSCAATSMFNPYTKQANEYISDVEKKSYDDALQKLAKTAEKSNDAVLYQMERGRIAQIGSNTTESKSSFSAAIDNFKKAEERALISASQGLSQGASLMTNDAAIPYEAKGYEKVFAYQEQALNYLFEKDLAGAAVEARRANEEQQHSYEVHEKEMAKVDQELANNKVSADAIYTTNYAGLNEIEGQVKNSFMNAYSHFTSGLISEIAAQDDPLRTGLNDAYIDYKRALEIYPNNRYLQIDAIRLAKIYGMHEDLQDFTSRFPEAMPYAEPAPKDNCSILVLFEDGLVPQMNDLPVPIPTPNGLIKADFPYYSPDKDTVAPLTVRCNDQAAGDTAVLCDVRALAVKSLKERFGGIVLREVLRNAITAAQQNELNKKFGANGEIIGSIVDLIFSRADLRAWYTLPRYVHYMRFSVPKGPVHLALESPALGQPLQVDIDTASSNFAIVRVVRVGATSVYQTVQFN